MLRASTATTLAAAAALSEHVDPVMAAETVAEHAAHALGHAGGADLAMLFVSGDHVEHSPKIAEAIRDALAPGTLLGVTADGVLAQDREVERRPAVSLFAAALPGTELNTFTYQRLPHAEGDDDDALLDVARAIEADDQARAVLFLADPFSVPVASAIEAIARTPRVVPGLERLPVIGGLASAAPAPGRNMLILDDQVLRAGGVAVTIRGDISIDTLVSQGCRPIGTPMLVTGAKRNIIQTLGGRPALELVRETVESLPDRDKRLVPNGLFIGRVVNEYKERFGRGDFLIRGVLGADRDSGAIAVGDGVRVGQTVQLHLRDASTAEEDLELLLGIQQLREPPAGALLFTCNGRGTRLFNQPSHDARAIQSALAGDSAMPLAGFFAAGEIGPIADASFVHGHTASIALFRPGRPNHTP